MRFLLSLLIFFTGGLGYADEAHSLEDLQDEIKHLKVLEYPYFHLIDDLKREGKASILIFSYGSLIDEKSAARTLSAESMKTRRAAIAYGLKRVFDRDVPISDSSRWCVPFDSEARGMLNVFPTGDPEDKINGVLIDVVLSDVPQVIEREEGYDLRPVLVRDWNSPEAEYKIAYTFHAPQGNGYTSTAILPRPGYYELTRDAAAQYGYEFLIFWFQTTYFSDGIKPIWIWELEVREKKTRTQAGCSHP